MEAFPKAIVFAVLLHCCGSFAAGVSEGGGDGDLVAVAVLYRHGDKSPSSSFPNDKYFDPAYWPMGFGQLTKQGKQRQYELGKWFRSRYDGFLPEEYNANDIYVLSTNVDRTLMSAEVNLAGLYPPKGSQVWDESIHWQPIPVHTTPTDEDQILYMERPCPKYNELYEETFKDPFFLKVNEAYADFYIEMSNLTGWDIDDVYYFYQLQQVLYVYSIYNSSYLPPWYSSVDQEKIEYLAGLDYARYTFTEALKRLGVGPFFSNLFSGFDKALNGTQEAPKFLMFSGHESTLGSVMNGMGVFDNRAPQFASCVIWEIRKTKNGEHYINMFYKKNSSDSLDQLRLNSCDFNCRYELFKMILSSVTLDLNSFDEDCTKSG